MTLGNPRLPGQLLASLALAEPPRVLLLRHADREAIAPGEAGGQTLLTPLGEQRALELRRALGQTPDWGLSSPLVRCTRTAELLGVHPKLSTRLGDPGPFVIDGARGGQVFREYGVQAVVRAQLCGETWGCMRSLEDGARLLLDCLRVQLREHTGTGIATTHDAILMPLITWATGERFTDDWLEPLDGAVLTLSALVWRAQVYRV